jgi:hypothetical protein
MGAQSRAAAPGNERMIKRIALFTLTLCSIASLLLSCAQLSGEEGFDGHNGPRGITGIDGVDGTTGELDLPCWRCVDRWALAINSVNSDKLATVTAPHGYGPAVGNSVAFADLAVGNTQLATGLAIGTTQLGTGAVTRADLQIGSVNSTPPTGIITSTKLANGAVTLGKIGLDEVNDTHIACDSVGPQNIAPGAVLNGDMATGAVELGDIAGDTVGSNHIAPDAVDTEHITMGAIAHIWTAKENFEDSLVPNGAWETIQGMELQIQSSPGFVSEGGPYLIMFDASFYSSDPNNETYIRLVLTDNSDNVLVVLAEHSLAEVDRNTYWVYNGWDDSGWCGSGCGGDYHDHNHHSGSAQRLGSISMHWVGDLSSYAQPHRIKVKWREYEGNTVYTGNDSDRVLTVIEFAKAEVYNQ